MLRVWVTIWRPSLFLAYSATIAWSISSIHPSLMLSTSNTASSLTGSLQYHLFFFVQLGTTFSRARTRQFSFLSCGQVSGVVYNGQLGVLVDNNSNVTPSKRTETRSNLSILISTFPNHHGQNTQRLSMQRSTDVYTYYDDFPCDDCAFLLLARDAVHSCKRVLLMQSYPAKVDSTIKPTISWKRVQSTFFFFLFISYIHFRDKMGNL